MLVFVFVRDGGKRERFAFCFEPRKKFKGKNVSELMKFNLLVFVRNGGKCERFASILSTEKNVSETSAP
jgi:hypothetical protein